ncbi:hypothetical protein B566_EDAN018458 [Ephemera danica]|nr:hypothetical protein B566_EDAN018458 [Ephemera danica]
MSANLYIPGFHHSTALHTFRIFLQVNMRFIFSFFLLALLA